LYLQVCDPQIIPKHQGSHTFSTKSTKNTLKTFQFMRFLPG
jgi:hypothetical protein